MKTLPKYAVKPITALSTTVGCVTLLSIASSAFAQQGPRDGGERLSPLAKAAETAAFSLRMNRGIQLEDFEARTGFKLAEHWKDELDGLVERGWGECTEGTFRLTPSGFRFADAAGAELLK